MILLDYSMPDIDGPETSRRIRDLYKEVSNWSGDAPNSPYIVCLTAFTEKFIEVNARESGMSDFITKPISLARLKKILRKCQLIGLDDLAE